MRSPENSTVSGTFENTVPGTSLLRLARGSIDYGLVHGKPLPVDCEALPPSLAETRATFTTLHAEGKLRGCCGTLEASQPLARDVVHSAFQAAFHDPRFDPVGKDEVEAISLEISVLSPMEMMTVADEADLLGRHPADIDGAGTATLTVRGVGALAPTSHRVVPDRLEAGTFAVASAITGIGTFWSNTTVCAAPRRTSVAEPLSQTNQDSARSNPSSYGRQASLSSRLRPPSGARRTGLAISSARPITGRIQNAMSHGRRCVMGRHIPCGG